VGIALLGALLAAAGCARRPVVLPPRVAEPSPEDLVVVVPAADGTVGSVAVTRGSERVVLDSPYAVARVRGTAGVEVGRTTGAEVRAAFGAALEAQPPRPAAFTVFFVFGTDEPTPESRQLIARIATEISGWPAAEVVVVGHTDRVGSEAENDELSRQRAQRVARLLQDAGIGEERIRVAGRGEREPLVATEDEVPEPRNRRVDITVR